MVAIEPGDDLSELSHGSSAVAELDQHQAALFCMMLALMHQRSLPYSGCWKSWLDPDGRLDPRYFWAGCMLSSGPIHYRLASEWWNRCHVAETGAAPIGGSIPTPDIVLEREINWLQVT